MPQITKNPFHFRIIVVMTCCATLFLQSFLNQPPEGEALFKKYCARCHGPAGDRGLLGAKNLKVSRLSDDAIIRQVKQGKGFMPSFKKKITEEELSKLVTYVKGLRTNTH